MNALSNSCNNAILYITYSMQLGCEKFANEINFSVYSIVKLRYHEFLNDMLCAMHFINNNYYIDNYKGLSVIPY